MPHTPGLWKHISRPISFTLVVDDFGIKYVGEEHAKHLIGVLEENYTMDVDWTGSLYCGINLDWNYEQGYVDISMPSYVKKNSSNMTILHQRNPNTAHTHPIQSNMAKQTKIHSQKIPAIYLTRIERNLYNKSLAASSFTHEQLT